MSRGGAAFQLVYADGSSDCREVVRSAFEPEWAVTTAETGHAADAAVDDDVDCLVVSFDLPDTDPISLYESLADTDGLPTVLFAADPDADTVRQAFRAGIDDVVYKNTGESPASGQQSGASAGVTDAMDQAVDDAELSSTLETAAAAAPSTEPTTADGVSGLRECAQELVTTSAQALEGTTLNVSRSLMSAAADEVDVKIQWALQSLATELDATQCLLYEHDDEGDRLVEEFGWRDDGVEDAPVTNDLDPVGDESLPAPAFPGYEERLQQFDAVCYDSTADDDPPEYDAEQGTLLALPIVIDWELTGMIVITTEVPRRWTESVRQQLTAVGELIGHTERRRRRRNELEDQNERLEQFTSVISHDLQNPLSVVNGYLELAMDTGDTEHLEPAVEAAERMETMLNELLTLAREGRAVGDTEPTSIGQVVSEAWSAVDTPEATLQTEGLEQIDKVSADPTRLQEAFENLFRNALDHVGEEVSITVSATENGVAVADDGPGIPEDEQDQIFEHGYTGGDGTGLGLAIVETIIEGHGWTIDVGNGDAGGAEFVIEFDDE